MTSLGLIETSQASPHIRKLQVAMLLYKMIEIVNHNIVLESVRTYEDKAT